MRTQKILLSIFLCGILCVASAACTRKDAGQELPELTVMTHDSFSISEGLISDFETRNSVRIIFLKAGDAGAALNQAILSKQNPMADIFYGVDTTFMSRALEADIFTVYDSPLLEAIPDELELDPHKRLLPVDFGDVCLNYDKAWFREKGIAPPASLEDLVKPVYSGLTIVENPATSSPGLAFLLTTIGHFGEDGYLEFWGALRANDVLVTDGWEDAYWGQFSASSKGERPIVVSYATSPPAEVHFAEKPLDDAPTAAVVEPGTAFRQVEFVGILKGAQHPELARKFIDYMLDVPFQEDIPLQMFVFPANSTAKLPEVFVKYARVAREPVMLPPESIAKNRENWIEAWTEKVLR
ncbi:MAG: thiamine ABC transporter substrate-binding protein [Desulfomonilia bacterium]